MNHQELPPFSLTSPNEGEEIVQFNSPEGALNHLTDAVAGFVGQNVAYLILPKK